MQLRGEGKLLEAQRLLARTRYDLEMMEEVGYCSGIENYSRTSTAGRRASSRTPCSTTSVDTCRAVGPDDWLMSSSTSRT